MADTFGTYFTTALPSMPYAFTPPPPMPPQGIMMPSPTSVQPSWFQKNKIKLFAVIIFIVVAVVIVLVIKKRKHKQEENDSMTNNQLPQMPQQPLPQQPQQQQRPASYEPNRPPPLPTQQLDGSMRLPTMVNPGANGMYPTINQPTPFPQVQQQPQMPQQQQGPVPVPINAGNEMTDPNFTPLPKTRR